MHIVNRQFLYICIAVLVAAGCTKGKTTFDVLDQNSIPQPTFDGKTTKSLSTSSFTQTFSIQGECDPKIQAISATTDEIQTSGFANLNNVAAGSIAIDCATTGKFGFTMKSLADLGETLVEGKAYEVQLRALTSGGISNPSTIRIYYSKNSSLNPGRILLSSGGTASSTSGAPRLIAGTGLRAEVRIHHMINNGNASTQDGVNRKAGGSLILKSGASATAAGD